LVLSHIFQMLQALEIESNERTKNMQMFIGH